MFAVLAIGGPARAQAQTASPAAPACPSPDAPAGITLTGTIRDPSGAPIGGASVRAVCGSVQIETQTAGDGVYRLQVPAGRFTVEVSAAKFAPASREAVLAPGANEFTLDISLAVAEVRSSVEVVERASYLAGESTGGTKTNLPLFDVPQAITVVTRSLLDDQGAIKLDDALKNVAGVMPGGYYDGWDYYRIRGFDASFTTYLDGMLGGNGTSDETWGLEEVEVLKGPSSALYGQSVLGGLINLKSKRPRPDAFGKAEFTGGSFGFLSPALDVGSSLNRSHSLYARLVALHRHQDSFVDYAWLHRTYLAPSLTWKMRPGTMLTLLGRYQLDNGRHAFPLPAKGTVLPNINGEIPVSRYVGELGDDGNSVHEDNRHLGYQFAHRFTDRIGVRQNFRVTAYRQNWFHLLYPGMLGDDERTLYRYPLNYDQNWRTYAVDTSADASVSTGAIHHDFLVGFDFFRKPNRFTGKSIDFSDLSQFIPIDLFQPVYGAVAYPPLIPAYDGYSITQFYGAYFQDHARITRRLAVTAGGRFNFSTNRDVPDPAHHDHAFTPRVGATYEVLPGATVYASYSRSYLPQSGRVYEAGNPSGGFAPPEKGEQWEGGFKSSLLRGRLTATLALFNLERGNVLTSDASHPNFYVLTGKQRSRGVELEGVYLVRSGWSITASYAYIHAKVTEDNDIPVGTWTQNVPHHSFNLWTRYEIRRGWASGLAFGFGGRYYTDQSGDLYDTFRIPGYGIVDASVSYSRRHFRVQLNAYNMSDTRYFTGSYDNLYVKPGAPRSARATVGFTF
ncbi:MAG TPA: TonB-dependent siderophore receptor [Bryobacteraceae bacterium]|nr:TonB-dependent siderophore receptor [Bryobacteraceae bacterium]